MMESITLRDVLPNVFVGEEIPSSDIWLTEVEFRRGGFYLVEAPSGGGKSSLMSFIIGERDDYRGEILFDGAPARSLSIDGWQQLRRCSIAYLPQDPALFPNLSALDNIRLKNSLTGHATEAKIREWMERLGVEARADYPAGKLSIGQQQRVAIIRALCMPFDFLMLDEPVSHLDAANNMAAAEIIAEEAMAQGAGIISTSVGNPLLLHSAKSLRL